MSAPVKSIRGLTFKQAVVTLAVVLALGVVGGAVELLLEWRTTLQETRRMMGQQLDIVASSAAQAAFQLNPALAEGVVDGFMGNPAVRSVRLIDNFGHELAVRHINSADGGEDGMAARLFADVTRFSRSLHYSDGVSHNLPVGSLDVVLSADAVAHSFFGRAAVHAAATIAKAIGVSVVAVAVFYFMITRPLVRLSRKVSAIDPVQPARSLVPHAPGHRNDEIGLVVTSLNDVLIAFQRGLDERDEATGDLKALTRELEERVRERTGELAAEKAEVERAYARLGEAHAELDYANTQLLESIQYARRIQAALLPDKKALGGDVGDIHVCWEPLHVVGGDYFWLERFDGTSLIMVMDCTGHGVPGAFMTMVVASALDRILHEQGLRAPKEILLALDDMVRQRLRQDRPDSQSDDGLDAAVCLWNPETRSMTYAGANLPLLFTRDGGVEEVRGTRVNLGYRTGKTPRHITEHVIDVTPGMSFYLLTDGIADHMGGDPPRLLGRRRLREVVAEVQNMPMAEQLVRIGDALLAWRGDEPRRDDMTLIGLTPVAAEAVRTSAQELTSSAV